MSFLRDLVKSELARDYQRRQARYAARGEGGRSLRERVQDTADVLDTLTDAGEYGGTVATGAAMRLAPLALRGFGRDEDRALLASAIANAGGNPLGAQRAVNEAVAAEHPIVTGFANAALDPTNLVGGPLGRVGGALADVPKLGKLGAALKVADEAATLAGDLPFRALLAGRAKRALALEAGEALRRELDAPPVLPLAQAQPPMHDLGLPLGPPPLAAAGPGPKATKAARQPEETLLRQLKRDATQRGAQRANQRGTAIYGDLAALPVPRALAQGARLDALGDWTAPAALDRLPTINESVAAIRPLRTPETPLDVTQGPADRLLPEPDAGDLPDVDAAVRRAQELQSLVNPRALTEALGFAYNGDPTHALRNVTGGVTPARMTPQQRFAVADWLLAKVNGEPEEVAKQNAVRALFGRPEKGQGKGAKRAAPVEALRPVDDAGPAAAPVGGPALSIPEAPVSGAEATAQDLLTGDDAYTRAVDLVRTRDEGRDLQYLPLNPDWYAKRGIDPAEAPGLIRRLVDEGLVGGADEQYALLPEAGAAVAPGAPEPTFVGADADWTTPEGRAAYVAGQRQHEIATTGASRIPEGAPKPVDTRAEFARLKAEQEAARAPWQMTRDEFVAQAQERFIANAQAQGRVPFPHTEGQFSEGRFRQTASVAYNDQVRRAIAEGQPVPEAVRAQFPDLAPPTGAPAKNAPSWKLTRAEYAARYGEDAADEHRAIIESAQRSGKKVPARVLADYPDLASTPTPGPLSARLKGKTPAELQAQKDAALADLYGDTGASMTAPEVVARGAETPATSREPWDQHETHFMRQRLDEWNDRLSAQRAGTEHANLPVRNIDRDLDALERQKQQIAREWDRLKFGPFRNLQELRGAAKAAGYKGSLIPSARQQMLRFLRDQGALPKPKPPGGDLAAGGGMGLTPFPTGLTRQQAVARVGQAFGLDPTEFVNAVDASVAALGRDFDPSIKRINPVTSPFRWVGAGFRQWRASVVATVRNIGQGKLFSRYMAAEYGTPQAYINTIKREQDAARLATPDDEYAQLGATLQQSIEGWTGQQLKPDVGSGFLGEEVKQHDSELGPFSRAALGALMSISNPSGLINPVAGAVSGAVRGYLQPATSAFAREMEQSTNLAARKATFGTVLESGLQAAATDFLARGGAAVADLKGRRFTPQEVETRLGRDAAQAWRTLVAGVWTEAETYTKFVYGDYSDAAMKGWKAAANKVFPFTSFVLNTWQPAARIAAKRPGVTANIIAARQEDRERAKREGRPEYLVGTLPIPGTDRRVDPLQLASPLPFDLIGGVVEQTNPTALQRVLGPLNAAGFQLDPRLQAAAYVTGQDWRRPGPLSRFHALEQAAPGPLVTSPAQGALDIARNVVSTATGGLVPKASDSANAVERRMAEIVQDRTKKPLGDPANRDLLLQSFDRNSPLYREAEADVKRTGAVGGAASALLPVSTPRDNPAANASRRAKESKYTYAEIKAAEDAGDTRRASFMEAVNDRRDELDPAGATYDTASESSRQYALVEQFEREQSAIKKRYPKTYQVRKRRFIQEMRAQGVPLPDWFTDPRGGR